MDLKSCTKVMDKVLSKLDNGHIRLAIIVILTLYASMVSQNLNIHVTKILSNPIIKIFVLFSILCLAHKDPPVALLLTIAFILSTCGNNKHLEHMENQNNDNSNKQNMIDEHNIVHGNIEPENNEQQETVQQEKEAKEKKETHEKINTQHVGTDNEDQKVNTENVETFLNRDNLEVLGYNSSVDCVKNCNSSGNLNSPCKGVSTFKNELNAQGLNCPLGNPGRDYASWD